MARDRTIAAVIDAIIAFRLVFFLFKFDDNSTEFFSSAIGVDTTVAAADCDFFCICSSKFDLKDILFTFIHITSCFY